MNTMSNSIMRRITTREKKYAFKVAIIGAKSVGKSALTVRIKTRKFIHNYAPNMESKCSFVSTVDGESVNMEILDTAALQTAENAKLEEKIKWADAFILMYSVTDVASLSALIASKCLINLFAKRRRKAGVTSNPNDLLVALVGNKSDMEHERMISEEEGRLFAEMNECPYFFELSTRESYDSVKTVFDNLYRSHISKLPKMISGQSIPRTSSPPVDIPKKDVSENALMEAAKRRDRSRTTMTNFLPSDLGEYSNMSPFTHRRIYEETTISSSGSPDDEHRFVGEQIIFDQSSSSVSPALQRRITVCTPPPAGLLRKLSHPAKRKQRKSTERNEYEINNNLSSRGLT